MRRLLYSLTAVAVVAAVALTIGMVVMIRKPLPDTSGEVRLSGLDGEVVIQRDAYGVPHITADTPQDLFFAQGYVHAQDRFHEMDVRRHVAAGRLTEVIGQDGTSADRLMRALRLPQRAVREARALPPGTRRAVDSYTRGVNAYTAGRSGSELGLEYSAKTLVGRDYRPEPWRPVDSVGWSQLLDWSVADGVTDEIDQILIARHMPVSRVAELYPGADLRQSAAARQRTTFADSSSVATLPRLREAVAAIPRLTGIPGLQGTDAWVKGGVLTARLGATVAIPSPWYQIRLRCRHVTARCPYDVSGFSLSAMPGVLVGANRQVAWGFAPTSIPPAGLSVARRRSSADGPVVATVPGGQGIVLRWDRLAQRPSLTGVLALNQARSGAGVRAAAQRVRLPFAVVYVDAHGTAGRFPAGEVRRRQSERSEAAQLLVPTLLQQRLSTRFAENGQKTLVGWDQRMTAQEPAAAYFAAVWRNVLARTFHDEVPRAQWPDGGDRWIAVVRELLAQPKSSWWDDLSTPQVVERRDDILRSAMVEARNDLTRIQARDLRAWDWGVLHGVTLQNPTLSGRLFERGPVLLAGSGDTSAATVWNPAAGYATITAPVAALRASLLDPSRSRWIVATGTSGHPFSGHYTDQTDRWSRGRSIVWPSTPEALASTTVAELRLRPPAH